MKRPNLLLIVALTLLGGAIVSSAEDRAAPANISRQSLYQAEAEWTDDLGQPFKLASLRGHPVVLAMFFTNCEASCPMLVEELKTLRDALPVSVRDVTRFVLLSMDVTRDNSDALGAYRERKKLDRDSWILAHGDDDAVTELAMLLGMKFKQDARGQFAHSNIVTVLNQEGEISHQRVGLRKENEAVIAAVTNAAR